jgi:hypothetical protein
MAVPGFDPFTVVPFDPERMSGSVGGGAGSSSSRGSSSLGSEAAHPQLGDLDPHPSPPFPSSLSFPDQTLLPWPPSPVVAAAAVAAAPPAPSATPATPATPATSPSISPAGAIAFPASFAPGAEAAEASLSDFIKRQAAAAQATFQRCEEETATEIALVRALRNAASRVIRAKLVLEQHCLEAARCRRNCLTFELARMRCDAMLADLSIKEKQRSDERAVVRHIGSDSRSDSSSGASSNGGGQRCLDQIERMRSSAFSAIEAAACHINTLESKMQDSIQDLRQAHQALAAQETSLRRRRGEALDRKAALDHKLEAWRTRTASLQAELNVLTEANAEGGDANVSHIPLLSAQCVRLQREITGLQAVHTKLVKSGRRSAAQRG